MADKIELKAAKVEAPKPWTPGGDVELVTTGGAPRYFLPGNVIVKDTPIRFAANDFTPEQWGAIKVNRSIAAKEVDSK